MISYLNHEFVTTFEASIPILINLNYPLQVNPESMLDYL